MGGIGAELASASMPLRCCGVSPKRFTWTRAINASDQFGALETAHARLALERDRADPAPLQHRHRHERTRVDVSRDDRDVELVDFGFGQTCRRRKSAPVHGPSAHPGLSGSSAEPSAETMLRKFRSFVANARRLSAMRGASASACAERARSRSPWPPPNRGRLRPSAPARSMQQRRPDLVQHVFSRLLARRRITLACASLARFSAAGE